MAYGVVVVAAALVAAAAVVGGIGLSFIWLFVAFCLIDSTIN